MDNKSNNEDLNKAQVGIIVNPNAELRARDINIYFNNHTASACPVCNNAAKKFSVIASNPQHRLAYTLAAPKEPLPPQKPKKSTPVASMITETATGGIFMIFAFILLAGLVAGGIALTEYRSGPMIGIAILVVVLVGLVSGILILSTNSDSSSKNFSENEVNQHYKSLLYTYQTVDHPHWKKAYEAWKSLYYCEHCGAIYQEGSKNLVGTINDLPTTYYRIQ